MDILCSPKIILLCDEIMCCGIEGTRTVKCWQCEERWPCSKYKATHSFSEIEKQERYHDRISHHGDEEMVEYLAEERKTIQAIEKELE